MYDNICDNSDNTCENYDNTLDKLYHVIYHIRFGTQINDNTCDRLYQLKLNDINCHIICHVEFGVQISILSIIILVNNLK